VNGTVHAADGDALQAKNDLTAACDDAAARPTTATVPVELGGRAPSKSAREVASRSRTAAMCAPHHGQQSREVIPLSATGQLGMAAHGQIQLTVVTRRCRTIPEDAAALFAKEGR